MTNYQYRSITRFRRALRPLVVGMDRRVERILIAKNFEIRD
jgi:hypothetical protein